MSAQENPLEQMSDVNLDLEHDRQSLTEGSYWLISRHGKALEWGAPIIGAVVTVAEAAAGNFMAAGEWAGGALGLELMGLVIKKVGERGTARHHKQYAKTKEEIDRRKAKVAAEQADKEELRPVRYS